MESTTSVRRRTWCTWWALLVCHWRQNVHLRRLWRRSKLLLRLCGSYTGPENFTLFILVWFLQTLTNDQFCNIWHITEWICNTIIDLPTLPTYCRYTTLRKTKLMLTSSIKTVSVCQHTVHIGWSRYCSVQLRSLFLQTVGLRIVLIVIQLTIK